LRNAEKLVAGFWYAAVSALCRYYRDALQPLADEHAPSGGAAQAAQDAGPKQSAAVPLDPEQLLRDAEEAAGIEEVTLLDAKSLKKLLVTLEKKVWGGGSLLWPGFIFCHQR